MTSYRGGGILQFMQHSHQDRKHETINHINRILGQLKSLKNYVETDKDCEQIASLTTSVSKSFSTLRARTLEGFILNEIATKDTQKNKIEQLKRLMNLYKK